MELALSPSQVAFYRRHGYLSPIDVMTPSQAHELCQQLAVAQRRYPDHFNSEQRNNAHYVLPFLAELALDERIVGRVRSLVGEDISLWSSVLFIKEPASQHFVSWHQDATYMALAPDNFVTAWVALTPSRVESGCVAVIPGSHLRGMAEHQDTFSEHNILTRGQQIIDVDESCTVNLVLEPGQMSLHHPWLIHGSRPNRSSDRRIGIAFQSYLGANVRPMRGVHYVMPIRGRAPHAAFLIANPPTMECGERDVDARRSANSAFADVLYHGAQQRRSL